MDSLTGSEAGVAVGSANFAESDSRKCPIAHEKQTWTSYKRDLDFWKLQCTLEDKIIGAHIVNRGFAKNSTFMSFKPLLELDKLGADDGYKYLTDTMTSLTKEGDPLIKIMRYREWLHMRRSHGEPISAYITRWTVCYNRAKSDAPFDISEQQAAYGLYLSFGFTEDESRSMSLLLKLDDSLTVKTVTDAVTRCQIVPKAAAQASASGNSRSQPSFAAIAEEEPDLWNSDTNSHSFDYEWDSQHGYLSFDSYQYDEQTETVLPVYWSEYAEDWVVGTDFGFLTADQCALCGASGHWWRKCPHLQSKQNLKGKNPFGKQKGKSGGKGFSSNWKGKSKGQFYAGSDGTSGDFGDSDWDAYFGKSKGGKKGKSKKGKGFGKPFRPGFSAPRSGLKLFGSHYSAPSENEGNPPDSQNSESHGDDAVLQSWANFVGPEFGFMTVPDGSAPQSQVTAPATEPTTPATESAPAIAPDGDDREYTEGELYAELADAAPQETETVGKETSAEIALEDLAIPETETRTSNEKYRLKPLPLENITLLETEALSNFLATPEGQEMQINVHQEGTWESRLVLFACDMLARVTVFLRADAEGWYELDLLLHEFRCFTLELLYVASREFSENFTRQLDIRKIGEVWKIRTLLSTPATIRAVLTPPATTETPPAPPPAPPATVEPVPPETVEPVPERPNGTREICVLSAQWKNLEPDSIMTDIKKLKSAPQILLIREVRVRTKDTPQEFHHRGFERELHADHIDTLVNGLNELGSGKVRWRCGVGDSCLVLIDTDHWTCATDAFGNDRRSTARVHCAGGTSAAMTGFDLLEVVDPQKKPVPMQFRFSYGLAHPTGNTNFATEFANSWNIPIWFGDPIQTPDGTISSIVHTGALEGCATLNPYWHVQITAQEGSVTVLEVTKPRDDKPPKRKLDTSRNAKYPRQDNIGFRIPPPPPSVPGIWAPRPQHAYKDPPWIFEKKWGDWCKYNGKWYQWLFSRYQYWGKVGYWHDEEGNETYSESSDGWDRDRIAKQYEEFDQAHPNDHGWDDKDAAAFMTTDESASAAPASALLSVPLQPGEVIYDPGCTADMGSAEGWKSIEVAMQQRWGFGFTKGESTARFRDANGGLSKGKASYTAQFQIPNVEIFKLSGSTVDCGSDPNGHTPVLLGNQACRDLELITRHKTGSIYSENLKVSVMMRLTSTGHWALPILDLLEKAGALPIPPEAYANFSDANSKNG